MDAFCGIEIVGDAMAYETNKVAKYHEYQEYPTLEESTVGEDESLGYDHHHQPQNEYNPVHERPEIPSEEVGSGKEGRYEDGDDDDDDEEQENTFSRFVVCYHRPDDATVPSAPTKQHRQHEDPYDDEYERPSRWGSSTAALCSSGGGGCPTDSPRSTVKRLSIRNTRDIIERSGSKLMLCHPQDYPEDAPNLLEDCDFEILAPQDTLDEGQAEEVQVLNPDIMEDLQSHLPLSKKGESFWLQYSLIRDGASMDSLLYKIRNTDHCVLAIETVDGDVFGAYTTKRWRYHDDFFGNRDAFLWRKNPDPKDGVEDVQCYHFSHLNQDVQLCTHDRLAVGGGIRKFDPEYGFGISLDRDLLSGTTSKSMTFLNPPLSSKHADGSAFEVRNIEVWALTPCLSLEDAQRIADRVQNNPIWA
ncbi:unnamed protein product [Cylindrotheca closterium]|uniref:Oxidation resistance protein 1 n=1 Tax=Cylindrotheca closterium TaxID=2856 RepID=A0AAD2GAN7_9STRA|nr:unnamed protein product [Cylindrotheca closterium]